MMKLLLLAISLYNSFPLNLMQEIISMHVSELCSMCTIVWQCLAITSAQNYENDQSIITCVDEECQSVHHIPSHLGTVSHVSYGFFYLLLCSINCDTIDSCVCVLKWLHLT